MQARFLVASFSSDWLFTPAQSEAMVDALVANGKDVSYCNVASSYGHDAFLLETEALAALLSGFLDATYRPGPRSGQERASLGHRPFLTRFEQAQRTRVDYELIESLIEPQSTVLDIGCGDGELLAGLAADKNVRGKGVELDQDLVLACVRRGVSIVQRDVDRGLASFADGSFDYVILSHTVQTIKNPEKVFRELLRIGRKVIVSFPNFAHWRCRTQLLLRGKAPGTKHLPFRWHNSPNIHCLSLRDFDRFCERLGVRIEKRIPIVGTRSSPVRLAPNLLAEQAIYVTSKA